MKITKKILVAILTLAVLVTAFAVTAFASNEPASDDSYKAVLEYYESNVYFADDFSEATDTKGTPAFTGKADSEFAFTLKGTAGSFGTTFKIVSNTYGDYLNLSTNNPSSFDFTPAKVESFGINMRASLSKAASTINIVLNTASAATPIVSIKSGELSVYDPQTGALVAKTSAVANGSATAPVFFDFALFYDVNTETLVVKLTPAGAAVEECTVTLPDLSFNGFKITANSACFDNMEAYAGSFMRSATNNASEIAAHVNAVMAKYDAAVQAGEADALKYPEVIYKLVNDYKYSTESIADTALKNTTDASIAKAFAALATVKAKAFVDGAAAISAELSYNERMAAVAVLDEYDAFITALVASTPGVELGQTPEAIASAREALAAEKQALATIDTESKALIAAVNALEGMKYFELSAAVAELKSDVEAANLTYEGVSAAVAKYNQFATAVNGATAASLTAELNAYYAGAATVDETLVAKYINKIVELYTADKTVAGALDAMYALYDVVTVKNYTTANLSDATLKATTDESIKNVYKAVADDNAAKLIAGVTNINVEAAYTNRLNHVNALKVYVDLLAFIEEKYTDLTLDADAATLTAAKKSFADEKAALEKIASDTKAAVAIVGTVDVATANYKQLRVAVEELAKYPICETFYDADTTAAQVSAAVTKKASIEKAFADTDAKAKAFVANVLIADNSNLTPGETAEQFKVRYDAYVAATENYFTDTTYNEYLENTTIEALLAIYASVDIEMNGAADSSEEFINAVNVAKGPLTYFALVEALENVKPYVAGANFGYPGVKEAYDEYVSLSEKVNNNYQRDLAAELLSYVNKYYYFNEDFSEATDSKGTPAFASKVNPEFKFALMGTAGSFGTTFKILSNTYGEYLNLSTNNPSTFDFTPNNPGSFALKFRAALTNAKSAINVSLTSESKTPLLKIEKESVSVYDAETAALVAYTSSITNSTATAPKFFDVDVVYKVDGEKATLYVVVTNEGQSVTYVSEVNATEFKGFQLTANKACFDRMQAYAGGTMGEATPEVIANTVNKLVEFYDAAPNADYANEILEAVSHTVTLYGYDYNTVTDTALRAKTEASVLKVLGIVGNRYAESFVNAVNSINKASDYNDRLNYVNAIAKIKEVIALIQTKYSAVQITTPAATIEAANSAYEAEVAELAKMALDTKASYSAVVVVPDLIIATYEQLRIAYDIIKEHPICDSFYDATLSAAEVQRAYALAAAIVAEYEKVNAKAESFVAGVLGSDNTNVTEETPEQFRSRYDNYIIAKTNYYADETYNSYLVEKYEITLAELIAIYDAVNAEMTEVSSLAESFLTAVNEANLTLSYSVKDSILNEWRDARANVELGYPGVSEAMALYSAIEQNVADKRNATKAYIEAVLAIESATDKQAAIAYAKSLAVNGSDVSVNVTVVGAGNVEVSVTEANIILSGLEGEILVDALRNKNFVDAVNAIAAANGLAAKREAIVNALSVQSRADAANAEVIAAVATLNAAIAEYNNGVNAANASMDQAANLATAVTAQVAPTKSMAQVVAIIKKFYE